MNDFDRLGSLSYERHDERHDVRLGELMSLYTILVFVALAVLGALIAYLGDVIGARVGKRRSTIFGLRPRQTARLVAAVIGGLLPLLGLGVATIGSRYARIAVFELSSLVDQRRTLELRVDELQQQITGFEERAENAEKRAEDAEATVADLRGMQEEQQERIETLQTREGELQARAADLQGRVSSLTERRDELQERLTGAQASLAQSEEELAELEEDLGASTEELEAKRREVEQRRRQVQDTNNQLDIVQRDLTSARRQLEPTRQELIATSNELVRLEEERAKLEEEYAEAEARLRYVTAHEELVSRTPEGLFEPGDELLRVVQRGDRTQDQVEADLFEWLHLASAVAERQGVPEGPNGRAVVLVAPTDRPGEVSERQIVQDVASQLRTEGPDEWVIMVRAFRRYFPGQGSQLQVHFLATPNELEFRKGTVLDEFVLAPSEGDARISELEAIQTLWRRVTGSDSPVRTRAMAEGMLPRPNSDTYGAVDLAAIYEAAQKIGEAPGSVLVRVRAAEDAYTRGPLVLAIDVQQVGEPS